jgi:hypothetical protein
VEAGLRGLVRLGSALHGRERAGSW